MDPDGKPYPSGAVNGRLIREEWKLVRELAVGGMIDTHYEKEDVAEKDFSVKPGSLSGRPALHAEAGSYAIELSGKDAKGRESFTRITFYSTGGRHRWESSDERQLEIVPDRKIYSPGDTARLLIKSPLAKGTYLVTVERDGMMEKRTVDLAGSAPTIDIPVTEGTCRLSTCSSPPARAHKAAGRGPGRPGLRKAAGLFRAAGDPGATGSRTIHLEISRPEDSYLPGTDASVTMKATWNGGPCRGRRSRWWPRTGACWTSSTIGSPTRSISSTAGNFPDRVAHYDSRDMLLDPVTWKAGPSRGGREGEAAPGRPGVRAEGLQPHGRVPHGARHREGRHGDGAFKLPDLLTRFRSTAVAAKGRVRDRGGGDPRPEPHQRAHGPAAAHAGG